MNANILKKAVAVKTRKVFFFCLICLICFAMQIQPVQAAGIAAYEFNPFTLTSIDPGEQMVQVAMAQIGLNLLHKYKVDWCVMFVAECAKLIGQSDAISADLRGTQALKDTLLTKGGQVVTSPRAGDLILYFGYVNGSVHNHTGLMINETQSIHGNWDNQVKIDYNNSIQRGFDSVNVIYIRPNYSKAKAMQLHPFVYNDAYYAAFNPDLSSMSHSDRIQHWLHHGIAEGRCASPVFNIPFYKSAYSDLRNAYGDNHVSYINHYVNNGMQEGRQASSFLDPVFYRSSHPDLQNAFGADYEKYIRHFLDNGIPEYRELSSIYFSLDKYRDNYLDLQQNFGTSPNDAMTYITHYFLYGATEGRIADHRLQISFDANGGTAETPAKDISFGGLYGNLPVPQRDGYLFTGWFTEPSGGIKVTEDTEYQTLVDSSVYAQWQPVSDFGSADLIVPEAAVTIEANAFENDILITSVDARNCTAIGDSAFRGCHSLTKIRLPKNCSIGTDAFYDTGLTAIYAPAGGTTEAWAIRHGILFAAITP